ncbi:Co/Ni ABC transporter CbiKLMQO, periplasmic substrate-binding protein CbiK [Campylobacter iguaniorum]|uniref:DUF4198 domain-containing protein n=1 Tax=Campylobacter iguaniorum TaxID=1244531 RepID=UPI000739FFEE|nr:DUF4198 domain-containing protein [Campylobacter iguaniorum]ALV23794.1 Co/Ni ABC transporter CbiKLMQO, periplasmic substrate-binding protein CbiK [Campylobacter iguaniorum]
MKAKFILSSMVLATSVFAHFGVVMPSSSTVNDEKEAKMSITYRFTHPFEQMMMNMEKPVEAGVFVNGKKQVFTNLKEQKDGKLSYWTSEFNANNPAMYQFYVDPKPYFEAAEDKFIRHITKTVVNAYGFGEGWDRPVGLKAEIVPLSRPYALYAGNIFSGVVLYKGKPAKDVVVEVEYYNEKGLKAPSEDFITQEVKTNQNGEFSFAMPLAGWWGFAALIDDDESVKKDGKDYPVELGGVIWVETKGY